MLVNNAEIQIITTANPPRYYTQAEVCKILNPDRPKIEALFNHSHIEGRYLYLPDAVMGETPYESPQQLQQKHLEGCLSLGVETIKKALDEQNLQVQDIDFLCCATTTGFLCPALSSRLIKELQLRDDVRHLDIVGMGCNAGLNALQATSSYCQSNRNKIAVLLCVEVCSAGYVVDDTIATAVVNSLFGDGAACAIMRTNSDTTITKMDQARPQVVDFESLSISSAIDAMAFALDDTHHWRFFLDREIPYVIGQHVEKPVARLLQRNQIKKRQVTHWIVHSGGKKVIDSIAYNLGLSEWQLRHTLDVLRAYGNLSSASYLFSFDRLLKENICRQGDIGVVIAMGPGTSIETALLRW